MGLASVHCLQCTGLVVIMTRLKMDTCHDHSGSSVTGSWIETTPIIVTTLSHS